MNLQIFLFSFQSWVLVLLFPVKLKSPLQNLVSSLNNGDEVNCMWNKLNRSYGIAQKKQFSSPVLFIPLYLFQYLITFFRNELWILLFKMFILGGRNSLLLISFSGFSFKHWHWSFCLFLLGTLFQWDNPFDSDTWIQNSRRLCLFIYLF